MTATTNKATPATNRVLVGWLGVDSGQFLITDPCYLNKWANDDFEDIRIYARTDDSGKRLQYRVHFENYEQPIASERGLTMNQLIANKTYQPVQQQHGNYNYSYNGACLATLNPQKAGVLDGGLGIACATAHGDGTYPVYQVFDAEGELLRVEIDFTE